ncbi:long-chain fatty acid--CoA ligase [uncultured Albimonas sp.]|uniref:acyl-CoA synthetase n=1 Tax=uncultured Albimonas sp. TaxID=1331701 RepID=UPI0030EB7B68
MNLTHGLRRTAQINANGVATGFEGRHRTWGEVAGRVARVAGGLRELGAAEGERVAILSLNSDLYLEAYLAVAWAGAVIVPLNVRWSAIENRDALEDCRARVLIVDRAFAELGAEIAADVHGLALVYADTGETPSGMVAWERLATASDPIPDAMRKAGDLAGIFYTGGTTGRSKGVMLSHGNLTANAFNALAEGLFDASCTYLHAAPMFHLANGAAMVSLLMSGGSNRMIRAFSPDAVLTAIQDEKITDVLLVPTMIQMLVDHPTVGDYDLGSLRRVVYGASPISEAVLDRATKALPGVEFVQAYGQTELSPIATLLHWKEHVGEARAAGRHRSAGRATLGCEVRIVDPDDTPVPAGAVGEICVRGDVVMMGYWERPEETAAALKGGWMHTGDGGYLDEDGFVFVVDRVKDMIITGGENVYSVEVENALAQHPAVAQAAVIGIPHEHWGEQVHAVVHLAPGAEVDEAELIAHCRARIAHYKAPRSVELRAEPLPLSGAGKILKRDLRAPFWDAAQRNVS